MPSTPILNITHLTAQQGSKEVTINNALDALEAANNDNFVADMSGGNVSLSDSEATRNVFYHCTGAVADADLIFPLTVNSNSLKRFIIVWNDTSYNITVKYSSGNTVVVAQGQVRACACDGTDWQVAAAAPATEDYSIPFGFTTTPLSSEVLLIHAAVRPFTLVDDFAGSRESIGTNPVSSYTMNVYKNASPIGTIVVASSGVTTWNTTGGAESFVSGDVLMVLAPGTVDANIANCAFTFLGNKDL